MKDSKDKIENMQLLSVKEKMPLISIAQLIPNFIKTNEKKETTNHQNSNYEINFSDIKFEKCISKTTLSEIYEGSWKGKKVMIKKFSKLSEKQIQELKTQCSKWDHPSLHTFYGYVQKDSTFYIVS